MSSLQDQLLQAGLASKQKAKQIQTQKRRQAKQQGKPAAKGEADAQRIAAQKAKDRELNAAREEAKRHQAERAQVKQLLDQHQVPEQAGEQPFNVVFKGKVKRFYVSEAVRAGLVDGSLAACRWEGSFIVVPAETARRIEAIRANVVVHLNEPEAKSETDAEDPYAQYQVPDDLMW